MKMILHREGLVNDENGGDFEKGKIDTPNTHILVLVPVCSLDLYHDLLQPL
jgi:hypothetical protein